MSANDQSGHGDANNTFANGTSQLWYTGSTRLEFFSFPVMI